MKNKLYLILISFFSVICPLESIAQYRPDILGNGYLSRTIQMSVDKQGELVCTLVKKTIPGKRCAILYVHGYNDYFFQSQLGDSIYKHGYNFYAVDLRKYGRSIRPNQDPFYCKSIKEYFADIDSALASVQREGNSQIILMGHSTGGLIIGYYMKKRKTDIPVNGIILNSPFLDWNFNWGMEKIVIPLVSFWGAIAPRTIVQGIGDFTYSESLLRQFKGEWNYNTQWKKVNGHPKRAGWIRAIQRAQCHVRRGVPLDIPVLVLSSTRSIRKLDGWKKDYQKADIVLDVKDIQKYGARFGSRVTCDTIPEGIHDLILSPEPARSYAYHLMFQWLAKAFGT